MIPFSVLAISFFLLWGMGRLGVKWLATPEAAGRGALVCFFVFTGVTHFTAMKHDYVAMIPDPLPRGLWVIYLTGVLEIAGAIGLLLPQTRRLAGICLALLAVAMFPANVHAALNNIPLRGQPPTPLWLRAPLQVLLLVMLAWAAIRKPAARPPQ